jgi:hypothetical protein
MEDGEDQDYTVGLIEVISQVIAPWVYERIGDVWDECE